MGETAWTSEECRYSGTDWMRGQDEPEGWEDRLSFDRDQWPEVWHLYERDLLIQDDMEWLVEAVFTFYRKHLDKLTRENDRIWGDFCKKVVDDQGRELDQLELNTSGYDMTDTNVEVPKNKKTVIPNPEKHFSFSTKLMVLAIDLLQQEAPKEFSSYTVYAHRKLVQFVENRKDLTAQSYRFFVEHAYNQFFQHEAFHQSPVQEPKRVIYMQVSFIHLQGLMDIFGSQTLARFLMFPMMKLMMWIWKKMMKMKRRLQIFVKVTVRSREEEKNKGGVSSLQKEETQKREEVSSKHDGITAPTQHRKRSS